MSILLSIAGLSKSTYYDNLSNRERRQHKDDALADEIKGIFERNYRKYGSPRVTIELRSLGMAINEKKVARIMRKRHISAIPKAKRYCSYKGEVGVTAPNLVKRHFDRGITGAVFGTDVTQFRIGDMVRRIPTGLLFVIGIKLDNGFDEIGVFLRQRGQTNRSVRDNIQVIRAFA